MKWVIAIFAIAGTCGAFAQGTFQNLDFESADVPLRTSVDSSLPIASALPGWSPYFITGAGEAAQPQVAYDGISLGGPLVSILDVNEPAGGLNPLQGNYSAILFGGLFSDSSLVSVGISQTGLVPVGTRSILVDAYAPDGSFAVTLGGQTIDMAPLESFIHYSLWGGNIPSSLAGQSETLSFVEPASATIVPTTLELDNISFSPGTVPEPDAVVLMGLEGRCLRATDGLRQSGNEMGASPFLQSSEVARSTTSTRLDSTHSGLMAFLPTGSRVARGAQPRAE